MKLFIALILGAAGLVMLLAGGTGSAQGLWTAIFTIPAGAAGLAGKIASKPAAAATPAAPTQSKAGAGIGQGQAAPTGNPNPKAGTSRP